MQARIAVFPGDGIGEEVTIEARQCLDLCAQRGGFSLSWSEGCIGGAAIDRFGVALPEPALQIARDADAILLGAVGGPKWDGPTATVRPEQALLSLRKELELFANLRPVRPHAALLPAAAIRAELVEGADILFVRELNGGIYYGQPSERRAGSKGREAVDTVSYDEVEVARVARVAFELARTRRRRLTSVDKANILSTSRLWREVVHEVAGDFPDVECVDVLVDAMAMHLMRRPRDFDVIVAENMFGDILTDEASVLTASLGMLPSASLGSARNRLGHSLGLYEPVHGTAPDIAGRDMANPIAAILSGAMLLHHSLGRADAANALAAAVSRVIASGIRTADIHEPGTRLVGCRDMGILVRRELESLDR